jgi:hypothetical protein
MMQVPSLRWRCKFAESSSLAFQTGYGTVMARLPSFLTALCAAVSLLTSASSFAQAPEPRITTVEVAGSEVTIMYELHGDPGAMYRVEFFLIDEKDPSRAIPLKRARGDVGENQIAGTQKKIVWDMGLEGVKVLVGQGYRFRLMVTRMEEGGLPWYVYAGGGVVVATAAILIFSQGTDEPPPPAKTIPLPPPR